MILRCTKKMLGLLGRDRAALIETPPTEDDWYANALWVERKKCVLIVHSGTLFSVFAADVRAAEVRPISPYRDRNDRLGAPRRRPRCRHVRQARPTRLAAREDGQPQHI